LTIDYYKEKNVGQVLGSIHRLLIGWRQMSEERKGLGFSGLNDWGSTVITEF